MSFACLVRIRMGDQVRAHIIVRPEFVIGRSAEADIPYVSSTVSRTHVRVFIHKDSVTVTDLNSNNGTFLDGIQLQPQKPIVVQNMNKIRLGASVDEFTFQVIPIPMELMDSGVQQQTLQKALAGAKGEVEALGRKALEEERRAAQLQIKAEREQTLLNLQNELDSAKRTNEQNCREVLEAVEHRAGEIISKISQDAQAKATERLKVADQEAHLIVTRAEAAAEKIRQDAGQLAKNKVSDAERKCAQVVTEANVQIANELAEQKKLAVDSIRAKTLEEQESIIKEYRSSIEKLHHNEQNLKTQLNDLQGSIGPLKSTRMGLEKEIEALQARSLEEGHLLNQIQDDLQGAQEMIVQAEKAQAALQEIQERADQARLLFEKYQSDYEQGRREIEDKLMSLKEARVLEYRDFKKRQDDELMRLKLDSLAKLKATIQDEEARYRQTLNLKAMDITRTIEAKLIPQLESHFKGKNVQVSLGGVLDVIQSAVNSVILKEKPAIKAVTEHLGLDPVKMEQLRQRNKKYAAGLVAAGIIALIAFGEPAFKYLKERRNTYTEQVISQRNAESIYTPLQNDDWKETYTGNILYLKNYYESKSDSIYEEQWALRLNNLELLRSLNLAEDDMIKFMGKEGALVKQLWDLRQNLDAKYLDEGLEKMSGVEIQTITEMKDILKTDENFESIKAIEKDFTRQFIKKKFGKTAVRLPTESRN